MTPRVVHLPALLMCIFGGPNDANLHGSNWFTSQQFTNPAVIMPVGLVQWLSSRGTRPARECGIPFAYSLWPHWNFLTERKGL